MPGFFFSLAELNLQKQYHELDKKNSVFDQMYKLYLKGNAYNWALGQGYSKEQAGTYSTLIGISQGVLQYALGGISKLGGKLTSGFVKTAI